MKRTIVFSPAVFCLCIAKKAMPQSLTSATKGSCLWTITEILNNNIPILTGIGYNQINIKNNIYVRGKK
ncbi:MAG: hypothetical protein LBG80_20415 [Bacteroidales bacterium]|jgi:hypothetical protein|nr:hypothetical protein [Bacteroidales bacterium]